MFEQDYLMRIIAQLLGAIRRSMERAAGEEDPVGNFGLGVKKTVILTGDSKSAGDSVARILGADEVYTELLPGDKVDKIEELIKELSTKGKLVFVGDVCFVLY